MHEDAPPHCGCCVRFHGCLVVDMVMSWGYCDVKVKSQPLSPEQLQHIKDETEAGNYEIIYALEKEGVLFMPSFEIATECPKYWDYQWGDVPAN
jgi:hypothetical protein